MSPTQPTEPTRSPGDAAGQGAVALPLRLHWQRALWLAAGVLSLVTGIVGVFVPVLPTTPFVLFAAFCFSRGCLRCERRMLEHPHFGPMVRDWRANRAVPLRAKQLSAVTMVIGCTWAAFTLPLPVAWVPTAFCLVVGTWLWRLPTRHSP